MKALLAIDVGNTNVKYALFRGGTLTKTWCHPTDQVGVSAAAILYKTRCPVALSSVVPAASEILSALLTGRKVIVVSAAQQDVLSGMDQSMGADRVADAVAAWKLHGRGLRPVIVVGMGTATTMLAISACGHVEGGFIAPGLGLSLSSLHAHTGLLPLLQWAGPTLKQPKLGYDTETHMRDGVLAGHIGLIRQWLAIAQERSGGKALTVATGGFSQLLVSACGGRKLFDVVDPHLTLKGIYHLAVSLQSPLAPDVVPPSRLPLRADCLHALELERDNVTLVIVDMQPPFLAGCKDPQLIPGVVAQVKLAISRGWAIVLLEVKPWTYGRTVEPIMELLEGKYRRFTVCRKEGDDGSQEVLDACRSIVGYGDRFFRVTGVLIGACVSRTAWGLTVRHEGCFVRVIREGCGTIGDVEKSWSQFKVGPRLVVSSHSIDV
ncbi:MAG: type III pantothenate kinase [Cyanobacteria bacterium SZAS LIN-3]|nr:type III pantothenate kinase [Cyanobacteria bacterium SZAS LIN-3]